ncbi:GNAT family N-acetyltransferase [Dellaglioa sp. BT-FLS60]
MTNHRIQLINLDQLTKLQAISRETFSDTFGQDNTPDDLEKYLTNAYGTKQLSNEIQQPTTAFYFIYVENQVAGYLKLNWDGTQSEDYGLNTLEVERIYISSNFKRLGLGTELINQVLITAQQQQKDTIWLGVWENNQAARHFYTKLGFKEIGEHFFQLGSDQQRDIIMQKKL